MCSSKTLYLTCTAHSVADGIAPAWLATLVVQLLTFEKQLYFKVNLKNQENSQLTINTAHHKPNHKID